LNENIIDKVISYFEFQKESFGKNLLVELPDYIPEQLSIIPSQKENKELPKLEKTKIETPVVPQEEPTISPDWDKSKTLDELYSKFITARNVSLESRAKVSFRFRKSQRDILVIGEAPGADEDEQGRLYRKSVSSD